MNGRLLFAISMISCFLAPKNAYSQGTPQRWSEREVFVFGPLVIDFKRFDGIESYNSVNMWKVTNCTTSTFYCANSHYLHIVVPRVCPSAPSVGDMWRVGKVTTTVLSGGITSPPLRKTLATTYLLGSPERPWIVWTYRVDTGIHGMYVDPKERTDLVQLAKDGGVARLNQGFMDKKYHFFARSTFDAFGHCKTSSESSD